ncbi:MAG TPA: SET domain-containing protein-lysine N-methyltransferase [Flavipsychrobacter sp.]
MELFYKLYIKETRQKGRGVFAAEDIPADVLVELSPAIVMTLEEKALLDKTALYNYIFEWQPEGEAPQCCMAQGYISVYNHSYASNCEYFMNYIDKTIEIRTVRAVAAGDELTINYNGDWNDENRVWFDVK